MKRWRDLSLLIRRAGIVPFVAVFLFGCGDPASFSAGEVEVLFDPGAEFPPPFPGSRMDTTSHLPPVIVGVSAPNDFLYPIETRVGKARDDGDLIPFLSETGLRGLFIQALPATGDARQNPGPFKEGGPESEVDLELLDSWNESFGALGKNGLQVFLKMDPGEESFWETRGGDPGRIAFFKVVADRFDDRDNLVFVADRAPGPRGPVVILEGDEPSGERIPRNQTIRHLAVEMEGQTPNQIHARTVRRWDEIGGRQSLTVFLQDEVEDIERARKAAWAAVMGGASVFQLGYEPFQGPSEILDDLGHLQAILSVFGAPNAVPRDDLPLDTTTWALAVPGDTYLLYDYGSKPTNKRIGLRSIPRGEYKLTWFDPETGKSLGDSSVVGREGVGSWAIPDTFGPEVALHIQRRDPIERIFPQDQWEYSPQSGSPITTKRLEALRALVGGAGCVVTGGYLLGCWGDFEGSGDWASVAKPVQTTLLFKAIAEGRLESVDAPIASLGWALRGADAEITMRTLANMTSGYARGEGPGTAFAYNDFGIQLYAESLNRVFGEPMDPVARRVFEPLRLEGNGLFRSRGGAGVSASVLDLCRIGWLWLNRGRWGEAEIVPRYFFDTYLRSVRPVDFPMTAEDGADYLGLGSFGGSSDQYQFGPGVYAYTWWMNLPHRSANAATGWKAAPPDMFFASGHQNREAVIVVESWDMVVAWRSDRNWGEEDMIPFSPASRMNRALEILGSLPPS